MADDDLGKMYRVYFVIRLCRRNRHLKMLVLTPHLARLSCLCGAYAKLYLTYGIRQFAAFHEHMCQQTTALHLPVFFTSAHPHNILEDEILRATV